MLGSIAVSTQRHQGVVVKLVLVGLVPMTEQADGPVIRLQRHLFYGRARRGEPVA